VFAGGRRYPLEMMAWRRRKRTGLPFRVEFMPGMIRDSNLDPALDRTGLRLKLQLPLDECRWCGLRKDTCL
jgi:hypothetical protein